MANGSLRAVVYAEGASNGADPLGFHSPTFTQNMSAGATAAGGAQQCLYVHPAAAAHLRRKREKKSLGRPSVPTSDASHAEAQRPADQVLTLR